ncbi:alpha/beta hydrolase [Longirhabdus pacifica]|uniref:alpha/beta hydrolase n=1 Tax=Longirhabdus pacifica TaxID=2305227 RepID=UPI0013E8AFB9|nr:alpha/beta hydrolase [Longirhabdus pacifica]
MAYLKKGKDIIHYEYLQSTLEGAETIILSHGVSLNMKEWDDIIPYLTSKYTIIRYDIRGHGKSTSCYPLTLETLCDDLLYLLDYLHVSCCHLVGDTLGAKLCYAFACQSPHRIQSLILSSTMHYIPNEIMDATINFITKLIDQHEHAYANYFAEKLIQNKENVSRVYEMMMDVPLDVCLTSLQLLHLDQAPLAVTPLQIPTLILWGDKNPFIPVNLTYYAQRAMPQARYLIVPNASQIIYYDQPDVVSKWMDDFIESNRSCHDKEEDDFIHTIRSYSETMLEGMSSLQQKEQGSEPKPRVEIQTLKQFQVLIDGKSVQGNWNGRKAKELLIYIAYHTSVTREQLIDTFWPDVSIEKAKNSLRVALNGLKKLTSYEHQKREHFFLRIDRECITLDDNVQLDIHQFLQELDLMSTEPDMHVQFHKCQQLLELCMNNFMPGLYHDWIISTRYRIEQRLLVIVEALIFTLEKKGLYHLSNQLKQNELVTI